jgi:flagellar biogenesis protein FliO
MRQFFDKTGHRRQKTLLYAIVLLVLGAGIIAASSRTETAKQSPDSPLKLSYSLANDADSPKPGNFTTQELFFKTMLAIAIVGVLGVGAVFVSKKLLPKITNLSGKEIRVIETTHLGPRKAIHLIEVCNTKLLLGSTNENISTLANLSDTWQDIARQDINDSSRI